jgi:hypothetical protein
MVSLYPGEQPFPGSCKGWELVFLTSPNIGHQVVKVISLPLVPRVTTI